MPVVRVETGEVILEQVRQARTHWQKFRGLMMDDTLQPNQGLWIERCKSIHTCFMKIPIDVLFVAKDGEIVWVIENMVPWRVSRNVRKAADVLECRVGTIERYQLRQGQHVAIVE